MEKPVIINNEDKIIIININNHLKKGEKIITIYDSQLNKNVLNNNIKKYYNIYNNKSKSNNKTKNNSLQSLDLKQKYDDFPINSEYNKNIYLGI